MKRPAQRSTRAEAYVQFKKLDHAAEIAYYYGFMPIRPPQISKNDAAEAKRIGEPEAHDKKYGSAEEEGLSVSTEEKIALLRFCEEQKLLNGGQPAMLYYQGSPARADRKKSAPGATHRINLDIVGTGKSVAEAELIKAAVEILREEGFEDLYVDINSLGDKDSMAHFARELGTYYRKHLDELQSNCKTDARRDPFTALECDNPKCREVADRAPKSVSFLTEPSRAHFKEVLEYLESMNLPYKIDNRIVGNRKLCCHTIFLIKTLNAEKENSPEVTLGLGYRYNSLAKKIDMKRDIPAVGLTLSFKRGHAKAKKCHQLKKPKVYFIQLGFGAKLKSLQVVEALRQAKIPMYQALAKDKLTSQIATAENLKIPYLLIMGQKEALEDSVIVRSMATRFQETVKIAVLADYLKKLD